MLFNDDAKEGVRYCYHLRQSKEMPARLQRVAEGCFREVKINEKEEAL